MSIPPIRNTSPHSRSLAGLCLLLPAVLAVVCARAPAAGAAPGTADGELKVGTEVVRLTHAHALEVDDVEGLRASGPQRSLVLLLTDTEVSARAVGSLPRCAALTYSGRLRGVEIRIDPATRTLLSGLVYFPVDVPRGSGAVPVNMGPVASLPSDGRRANCTVQDLQVAEGRITGTALLKKPEPWPHLDREAASRMSFHYRVSFQAPVSRQPAVTAVLTGPSARSSPQLRALLSLDSALRKGDLAAARQRVTTEVRASWDHLIKQWGLAEFKKVMARQPDAATRARNLSRVVVRGGEAKIVFREPRRSDLVIRQNGRWLVAAPG
jgi:hypothetical protein